MAERWNRKDVYNALQQVGRLIDREVPAEGDRKPGTLGIEEGANGHLMIVMRGARGRPGHNVFHTGYHRARELCYILGGIIAALDLKMETDKSRFARDFETRAKASDDPSTTEFIRFARSKFDGLPNMTDLDLLRCLQGYCSNWTLAMASLRAVVAANPTAEREEAPIIQATNTGEETNSTLVRIAKVGNENILY